MSEMVERVAQALRREDPVPMSMLTDDDIRALARAAINAMRKPTQDMCVAGQGWTGIASSYQRMIDEALK